LKAGCAQIGDPDENEIPLLLVDDLELTGEDSGRLLRSHAAWNPEGAGMASRSADPPGTRTAG
jgi:hypothetical protein